LPLINAVCQLFTDPVVLWKFPEDFGDQVGNMRLNFFSCWNNNKKAPLFSRGEADANDGGVEVFTQLVAW